MPHILHGYYNSSALETPYLKKKKKPLMQSKDFSSRLLNIHGVIDSFNIVLSFEPVNDAGLR